MPPVLNISDLRDLAKRRMPRVVFDYLDGAAEREITLRANEAAFDDYWFRPRGARKFETIDLGATVLGQKLAVPFVLAPMGSTRMFYPRGEPVVARCAEAIGTAYTLSTLSGTRVEEVREATRGPLWYQLYLVGGREVASAAIERAKSAGCTALMVTIDTGISGLRERDFRDGIKELLSGNPIRMFPHIWQFLACPRWCWGFLWDGGLMRFPNVRSPDGTTMPYADVGVALERAVVTWDDLAWIRELWNGPLIVKGVHVEEDARRAADEGATAIVVSNHGGRQLDGALPTLRALPSIVAAVGDQVEVLMDGGIRTGSDMVKALCLGARAVLIGRAYGYGLGAAGEAGVRLALEILRTDLVRTLKLLGCGSIGELGPTYLERKDATPARGT